MSATIDLKEIPPLPFDPTVASVTAWLDGLPVGNTLKSCQVLYPVLFSLRLHPVPLRTRFDLLEVFQPVVFSLVHSLSLRITHKPLVQERTQRILAGYGSKFHTLMGECYRELLRHRSFIPLFERLERAAVVARAMEHQANAFLRMAQAYEMPPAGFWPRVVKLYRYAEAEVLLDEPVKAVSGRPTTPRGLFQRTLLFRLAAPGRMGPRDMQVLFDRLATHAGSVGDAGDGGLLFRFDASRPGIAVPRLCTEPPERCEHYASAGTLLSGSVAERLGPDYAQAEGLIRALPRIGRPIRGGTEQGGAMAQLFIGFKAVAMALRYAEARTIQRGGVDYWPPLARVEFAPLDDDASDSERDDRGPVAQSLARADTVLAGPEAELSLAECLPAELPGYYLVDTGFEALRAGHLLGIRAGEDWPRVAAVRAVQRHEGRLRHSLEVLGVLPRLASVRGEGAALAEFRTGFVLDDWNDHDGLSLLVPPVRWEPGYPVRVDWFRGQELFLIGRLLEWNADFCHFELITPAPEPEPAAGETLGPPDSD